MRIIQAFEARPKILLFFQQEPTSTADGVGGGCQVLALVVAPGRELVTQLWHLFQPLCKTLGMNALKLHGAGGERKKRVQDPRKYFKGQWSVDLHLKGEFKEKNLKEIKEIA